MKRLFFIIALFLCVAHVAAQDPTIDKGSGNLYFTGKPGITPNTTYGSEYAIDLSALKAYIWNRDSSAWYPYPDISHSFAVPSGDPGQDSKLHINRTTGKLYQWTGSVWSEVLSSANASVLPEFTTNTPTKDSSLVKLYRDASDNSTPKLVDSKSQAARIVAFDNRKDSADALKSANGFWGETISLLHTGGAYKVTSTPSASTDSLLIYELTSNPVVADNWLYHSEENSQTDNASQVTGLGATWIATGLTTTNDIVRNKEGRKTADMHILTATSASFNIKFDNPDTIRSGDSIFFQIDILLGEASSNNNVTFDLKDQAPVDFTTIAFEVDTLNKKWQTIQKTIVLTSDLPRGDDQAFKNKVNLRFYGDIGDTIYTSRAQIGYARNNLYKRTILSPVLTTDNYYAEYITKDRAIYIDDLIPLKANMTDGELLQKVIDYCAYSDEYKTIYLPAGRLKITGSDTVVVYGNVRLKGTYKEHNTDDYAGVDQGTTILLDMNDSNATAFTFDNIAQPTNYNDGPGIEGVNFVAVSEGKAAININRSFGNPLKDIRVDGGGFLEYGVSSVFNFTETPGVKTRLENVEVESCTYGFYFPKLKTDLMTCSAIRNTVGLEYGGNRLLIEDSWFEDNDSCAINIYKHPQFTFFDIVEIRGTYFEGNADNSTAAVIRAKDADKIHIIGNTINHSDLSDTLMVFQDIRNVSIQQNQVNATPYQQIHQTDCGQIDYSYNHGRTITFNSFMQNNPTLTPGQLLFIGNTSINYNSRNYAADYGFREIKAQKTQSDTLYLGGTIFARNDTIESIYQNLVNRSDSITFLANANYNQSGRTVNPWGDSISNVINITSTQTSATNYFGIKTGENLTAGNTYTVSLYAKLLNSTVQSPANASYRYFRLSAGTGLQGLLGPFNHNEWQRYELKYIPATNTDTLTVEGLAFVAGDTFAISSIQIEEMYTAGDYIETTGAYVKQTDPKTVVKAGTTWVIDGAVSILNSLQADSLLDSSGDVGASGQVAVSTGSGWDWRNLSYGEAYVDYIDPDSVTVVTAGNLYDFTDVLEGSSSSDVTVSTTTGRLTYTGTTEKLFEITWSASVTSDAVNENLIGTVMDNGATITRIRWEEEDTAAGDRHSVIASGFFSMGQNDWVQPKLTSQSNGTQIEVITMSFRIKEVR